MAKWIESPKYNVISVRITDEEKALLDEMKRNTRKSAAMIVREVIQNYQK